MVLSSFYLSQGSYPLSIDISKEFHDKNCVTTWNTLKEKNYDKYDEGNHLRQNRKWYLGTRTCMLNAWK